MPRSDNQGPERYGPSVSETLSVEDHGRVITANGRAATFYRQAQRALDLKDATTSLELTVAADPNFELAVADLDSITLAPPNFLIGRTMTWERHHIEVVRMAAAGNFARAADLLREHLASVGCDPLALRIVTELGRKFGCGNGLQDLLVHFPPCHPGSRAR